MPLREKTIRLAYHRPHLREHLLPLLRSAAIQHAPRRFRDFLRILAKSLAPLANPPRLEDIAREGSEEEENLNDLFRSVTGGEVMWSDLYDFRTSLKLNSIGEIVDNLKRYLVEEDTRLQELQFDLLLQQVPRAAEDISRWEHILSSFLKYLPTIREEGTYYDVQTNTLRPAEAFVRMSLQALSALKRAVPPLKEKKRRVDIANRFDATDEDLRPAHEKVETLYHASVDATQIGRSGFRKGKGDDTFATQGLGGAQQKRISFTSDLYIAKEIARTLKEVVMISQGKYRLAHMLEVLDKDHLKQKILDYFAGRGERKPQDTPEQVMELYFMWIAHQKRRYNPGFMVTPERMVQVWKGKRYKDIGVVVAKVDMTNSDISYVAMEREFRVPPEAVLSVEGVIR